MKFKGSFGEWLKQRRKALDLTQQDLADQVGCAVVTISKIEEDVRRASKQIIERLADALVIAPDERAAFVAFARPPGAIPPAVPVQPIPPTTPSLNLPTQPTAFVGRTQELALIARQFTDPACRLLTLVGVGGVGKTRLALQAAENLSENFADGVHFVSLASVGSPGLLPSAIASALKLSLYGAEEPSVQLINYLREKDLLLILDNIEHLLEGVGLLSDILANVPQVKILVTSRERLNLQEEWVIHIDGLSFPVANQAVEAEGCEAVELFVQRACQAQPDFLLIPERAAVLAICQHLEGLPLAIELAATWLRIMPCREIALRTEHALDFLTNPLRNVPERHRSLRAVFEQSWSLLSEAERSVLAKLSVFHGGFDLQAAEQVAWASPSSLRTLVDKSLVRLDSPGRYSLHELLRQFTWDKLVEASAAQATSQRHCEFFLNLAERAAQEMQGPRQLVFTDQLETELDNIRASLEWSSGSGLTEMGLRLAVALGEFWWIRAHVKEGMTWLDSLPANRDHLSPAIRARALYVAGHLTSQLGNNQRAQVLCEESLALARQVGDKSSTAWALFYLGHAVSYLENYSRAVPLFEEALMLFRETGATYGIAGALNRLGRALTTEGDYAQARLLLQESINLARTMGHKRAEAWGLYSLANIDCWQGNDLGQVKTQYHDTLMLFQAERDKFGVARALWGLATVTLIEGDYAAALEFAEESLARNHEMGNKGGIIESLTIIGAVACAEEDFAYARQLFEEALKLSLGSSDYEGTLDTLVELAVLASAQNSPERAARLFGRTEVYFRNRGCLSPNDRSAFETALASAREQLGEAIFNTAFMEGRMMTLEQAAAYALNADNHAKPLSNGCRV